MQKNITNYLLEKSVISDSLTYATSKITSTAQCDFIKQSPTSTLYLSSSYISDPNTDIIINILKQYSKDMWSQYKLSTVETRYRQHLQEQRIMLHDVKLILLKPIFKNVRLMSLIVVTTSIFRKSSSITMLVPQTVTWENIKLYSVSVYGFSGMIYEKISKNELKDTLTM